jgi:hypothetical protein
MVGGGDLEVMRDVVFGSGGDFVAVGGSLVVVGGDVVV